MTGSEIELWLQTRIAETLRVPASEIERERSFAALGLDSLTLLTLTGDLAAWLGHDLPVTLAWESPTIAAVAERLSQEALPADIGPSADLPREGPAPLSLAQEQMWRECHALPDQHRHSLRLAFRLRGAVDEAALRHALDALVARHEILRTTFGERIGEPVQVVHPPGPAAFSVQDCGDHAQPEEQAQRLALAAEAAPFDLERGPLFRALLLRAGEGEFRLVLTLHHLLADFQAIRVLYQDLCTFYAGETPRDRAAQVADLAQAERQRPRAEQLAWWLQYWARPSPSGGAPGLRRRRTTTASLEECFLSEPLSAETLARLETLARAEETTLYGVALAAFEAALLAHAGPEELVLGTFASTRRPEAQSALGLFINHAPIRANALGLATFRELLARVRETLRNTALHHELPFAQLSAALRARGQEPPAPEIQFQLLHSPRGLLRLRGVETTPWRELAPLSEIPHGITLSLHEQDGEMRANLTLDARHYHPRRVVALYRDFLNLLAAIGDNADAPLPPRPRGLRRWFAPAISLWQTARLL